MRNNDQQGLLFVIVVVVVVAALARRRWRPSTTAFGTAHWATEKMLQSVGMLGNIGLILGRTMSGKMIRAANYCHVLLVGGTGSGKGVSIIIPNLLAYFRGSVVVFDTKGDLHTTCGKRREARGERIIKLAPFLESKDTFNPLDTIHKESPTLIDSARAMAEALVVRSGSEPDPHWNDRAVQVICAVLILVLMRFEGEDRSLNSVQEIASDPKMLAAAADKLREMHSIPARLGNQLMTLFDPEQDGTLSKEGAGVLSTVARHLSFLDSELVARSVASSTFDPALLLKPGTTLFLTIPPDQLEAQKGLLRCWISTLVRMIGTAGNEKNCEVLFLLDEAEALHGLSAVEESLVRGRSAGVRMLLAYQSDSQVRTAFKDKPTLLYDNCSTQIYLGASSIETAERISKSLGEWTQVLEGYGVNNSRSWNEGGSGPSQGQQLNQGSSFNYSVNGRALLQPSEILKLSDNHLIAFLRGMPPILARRIKWYQDRDFNPVAAMSVQTVVLWLVIAVAAAIIASELTGGK
ncbi:MAG TPA: type IV secretory system conjugative DNA transfer family protein [Gemmata sp.]|jgi:type IV secretion system protein VirD4|nr:type IV secretory system conjugative DNA transfer family protein [Gemmata sp.]